MDCIWIGEGRDHVIRSQAAHSSLHTPSDAKVTTLPSDEASSSSPTFFSFRWAFSALFFCWSLSVSDIERALGGPFCEAGAAKKCTLRRIMRNTKYGYYTSLTPHSLATRAHSIDYNSIVCFFSRKCSLHKLRRIMRNTKYGYHTSLTPHSLAL